MENIKYYPLYEYKGGETDRKFLGVCGDIFYDFSDQSKFQFKVKALPVVRLFKHFCDGKVDLKFPDNKNWGGDFKKGKTVIYSDPIVQYIDGVLTLKGKQDLKHQDLKKLGTVRGFTPWDYIGDIKEKNIELHEGSSLGQLLQMLKKERIDGIYGNVAVCFHEANKINIDIAFCKQLPHTKDNYHLSTIEHPEIIEEFNAYLKNNQSKIQEWVKQHKADEGIY